MAEEPRFDWSAILQATAIIVGVTAVIGFVVPIVGTLALDLNNTGRVSGNQIYRWGYWAVSWALTIWQGAWMVRKVHERIIDDMLVTSVIAAVVLFIIKIIIAFVYEPVGRDGQLLSVVTSVDAGGALILVMVALIGARTNRY